MNDRAAAGPPDVQVVERAKAGSSRRRGELVTEPAPPVTTPPPVVAPQPGDAQSTNSIGRGWQTSRYA
jgi:hypothetical protein